MINPTNYDSLASELMKESRVNKQLENELNIFKHSNTINVQQLYTGTDVGKLFLTLRSERRSV